LEAAARRFTRTVLRNPFIPHKPSHRQALFLLHDDYLEALYGGAAGGGKSDALLMAALQYVHIAGYSAILFRRTYADLNLRGALMDRAADWLIDTPAKWSGQDKRWTFPGGASLSFGYLEHDGDERRYKSAEFQFIGVDEATDLPEQRVLYLFSRLRRVRGIDVPLRLRMGTNPGGPGHEWVKKRFLPDEFLAADDAEQFAHPWYKQGRAFVPARLEDNPHLDAAEYEQSLAQLDPVTRAQLRKGDWKAHAAGRFRPEWFRRYRRQLDVLLCEDGEAVRYCDLERVAVVDPANRQTKASKYTALGAFGFATGDRVFVLEVEREQLALEAIVPRLDALCARWGPVEWAGLEANGFQRALALQAREARWRHVPTVRELDPEGKGKLTRATKAILRAEAGLLYVPEEAPWVDDYVAELCQFTGDERKDAFTDQVDITAYAVLGADRYSGSDARPMALGV
jgi:predicted phage terminase large subunit-like protein